MRESCDQHGIGIVHNIPFVCAGGGKEEAG